MTEREAPPNWGFDYMQDDPYDNDGWFGREEVAEQTPVDEVPDRPHSQLANIVREEPYVALRDIDRAPSPPTRRLPPPTVNTWTANGQLRASNNSVLTFRAPPSAVVSHQAGKDRANRRRIRRCRRAGRRARVAQ